MRELAGIGVSEGIAIGRAVVIRRDTLKIIERKLLIREIDVERQRFLSAIGTTLRELAGIRAKIAKGLGEKSAEIIDAQILLLQDNRLIGDILELIETRLRNAEYLVQEKMDEIIAEFSQRSNNNPFMLERVQDLQDLKNRLLWNIIGKEKRRLFDHLPPRSIVVISNLAPSESVQLFGRGVAGLVSERGGRTSHMAIIAKTLELPAVLGVEGACELISTGEKLVLDGDTGRIVVNPPRRVISQYRELQRAIHKMEERYLAEIEEPPITEDGHRVTVSANIEIPEELDLVRRHGAEGVGLLRTELLYISQSEFPSEELQWKVYSELAEKLNPDPLIIRTFDIGGDKLSYKLSRSLEPNPFLGWRAIRIGLTHPELLKPQLRAILKASASGNVKLMFPMISSQDEVERLLKLLEEAKMELNREGVEYNERLEVGIMVEIPSAALLARELAKLVDFFSIGTNDLIQYTLAADRGNQKVADYYQSYNPSVIRLMKEAVDGGHSEGIWVGLCGEMAGDPKATIFLLGLGIDEFSCVPRKVPIIKSIIRSVKLSAARRVAESCLRAKSESEVVKIMKEANRELLPEEFPAEIWHTTAPLMK